MGRLTRPDPGTIYTISMVAAAPKPLSPQLSLPETATLTSPAGVNPPQLTPHPHRVFPDTCVVHCPFLSAGGGGGRVGVSTHTSFKT